MTLQPSEMMLLTLEAVWKLSWLSLSARLPVCSSYAAAVDCRCRNSRSEIYIFGVFSVLKTRNSVISRNRRGLGCVMIRGHIFIQLLVSLFFLSRPLVSLLPLPPSPFFFFLPPLRFLHLPLGPVSLWQMSVVRGHVVVIRRALPWHSASLPVSNLREGRLRFRQPWEQLFAAGAQPSNSANLNKTVFNLSSQSHNIYHKASRHYASSTLQFPLLPDGLHNRRGTEALECERPHGATIDLSTDNDIIYQVVNLVVTFLFVFFYRGVSFGKDLICSFTCNTFLEVSILCSTCCSCYPGLALSLTFTPSALFFPQHVCQYKELLHLKVSCLHWEKHLKEVSASLDWKRFKVTGVQQKSRSYFILLPYREHVQNEWGVHYTAFQLWGYLS